MNIYEITFSPTGGTKKIADFLAAELRREIKCILKGTLNKRIHLQISFFTYPQSI